MQPVTIQVLGRAWSGQVAPDLAAELAALLERAQAHDAVRRGVDADAARAAKAEALFQRGMHLAQRLDLRGRGSALELLGRAHELGHPAAGEARAALAEEIEAGVRARAATVAAAKAEAAAAKLQAEIEAQAIGTPVEEPPPGTAKKGK